MRRVAGGESSSHGAPAIAPGLEDSPPATYFPHISDGLPSIIARVVAPVHSPVAPYQISPAYRRD